VSRLPPILQTLLAVALLCVIVLAGDRALAGLMRRALPYSGVRFSLALRPSTERRVLVLGNSRAATGFNAPEVQRRLGVPTLNLAYNGMSTVIAEAMLRGYLAHNAPPRLLVYELDGLQSDHVLVNAMKCYWDEYPALGELAGRLHPRSRAAMRLFHLYAFNGEAPLRALYYARRTDQNWGNFYRISPEIIDAARAEAPFVIHSRDDDLAALQRIARLARDHGFPLRLVVMPYLHEHIAHATNYAAWVDQARRVSGEPVWDYGHAEGDVTHFADRVHLNEQGSVPFVARLVGDGFFADSAAAPVTHPLAAAAR